MPKQKDKLARAKELMNLVNEGLTRRDFTDSFKNVIAFTKTVEANLTKGVRDSHQLLSSRLESGLKDAHTEIDKRLTGWEDEKRVTKELKEHLNAKILSLKDGKDGKDGADGSDGKDADPKAVVPHFMAYLKQNPLKVEDIDGLQRVLDEHHKRIADRTAIGISRPNMTYLDLSASLDGNTVTFNIHSFQKIISIHLSSIPNILRPAVDYTWSNSPPSITFIGDVATNKATVLSAGQTAIVLMLA